MISQLILVIAIFCLLIQRTFSLNKEKNVYGYFDDIKVDLPHHYLSYFKEHSSSRRFLQTSQTLPQPIRITLDFTNITDTINGITPLQNSIIQKIVITARSYLQKLVYVVPRTTPVKASFNDFCGDQKYPDYLQPTGAGVADSDYHVIVRYYNNPNDSVVAKGGLCAVSPSPIIGQISFNIGDFVANTPSHKTFKDYFEIALHELIHSIGFGSSSFSYWINPDTESPYSSPYDYVERGGNTNVKKLITKNVVAFSQFHYNCQTIDGLYLENQGSSFAQGQHWERDLMPNEIMTGGLGYGFVSISEFTASALRDSGFFAEINSNVIDPIYFGKNKGCDFFQNTCNSTITTYPEYIKKKDTDDYCDYEGVGIAYFSGMFSQCGLRINFNLCSSTDDISSDKSLRFNTGEGSRCFESNAKERSSSAYSTQTTRCFKIECSADQTSMKVFTWGTEYVTCTQSLQVIDLSVATSTTTGTLTCPDNFTRYCNYPKYCKNYCNSNGYCQNGMCNCNSGWTGEECNIQCAENQALSGSSCVSQCPAGTYKNPNNVLISYFL